MEANKGNERSDDVCHMLKCFHSFDNSDTLTVCRKSL